MERRESPDFRHSRAAVCRTRPMNECRKLGTRKGAGNGDFWVCAAERLAVASDPPPALVSFYTESPVKRVSMNPSTLIEIYDRSEKMLKSAF